MDNQADGHNISKGAQIAVSSCSDMHRVEGHGDKGRMHAARGGIAGRPKRIANVSGAITLFSPTINHMTIAFQLAKVARRWQDAVRVEKKAPTKATGCGGLSDVQTLVGVTMAL
eukprot:scaffold48630_cov17-Tisochrysis_lutea.AAC.1